MNLRVLVVLSMIACGGSSDEPKPSPGSGSAPGSGAAPKTGIRVPVAPGVTTTIGGNVALAITDDGLRLLGPVDPAHLAIGGSMVEVDDHGQLGRALPAGDPATAANLAAAISAAKVAPDRTLVFAEPTRNIASLDALHSIGSSCTNLAVAANGHLYALPICFPRAMTGPGELERIELIAKIGATQTDVILPRVDHTYVAHDAAELDQIVAEQKASFHDRTDAGIVVDRDATIGQVASAVAALRKAGFAELHWIIPAEPPKPAEHPAGVLNASPVEVSVAIECSRVDGGSVDDGARVVKARVGVFRACFQKELPHGAHDGAADVSFGVDNGKVTSVTIAGKVPSAAVAECTKVNIQRLVFPAGIRAVRCAFTYKHVASGGR